MKKKLPVITFLMIGLNLAGFIYEYKIGQNLAILKYGMFQGALTAGQYDRLIGNAFLHFGFYHFTCNMICLVSYGFSLENRIGPLKFLIVYCAAIAGAGILIDQAGGNGIHAGASGAVWGLMTATLVYNLRNKIDLSYALRGIIFNLIYSFSAGVSWQAHIGGGIAGLLVALIIFNNERQQASRILEIENAQSTEPSDQDNGNMITENKKTTEEHSDGTSFTLKFRDLKPTPLPTRKARGWTCKHCGTYNEEGIICRKCSLYK